MMKWFIGVSTAVILALIGWIWAFILMGYKAQADIETLQDMATISVNDRASLHGEIQTLKEISLRTEANTEKIRDYLLKRAMPPTGANNP